MGSAANANVYRTPSLAFRHINKPNHVCAGMQKTFIGRRLRRLRLEPAETLGAMARALGISGLYVNLLENNERSVSLQVPLRLFDAYGVDWREIAEDDSAGPLTDLRFALQDPIVTNARPDRPQVRGPRPRPRPRRQLSAAASRVLRRQ